MTEREMLELAAKAYGIGPVIGFEDGKLVIGPRSHARYWSPRLDDGDALRLLARMKANIECAMGTVRAYRRTEEGFWISTDRILIGERDEAEVIREAITSLAVRVGAAMS